MLVLETVEEIIAKDLLYSRRQLNGMYKQTSKIRLLLLEIQEDSWRETFNDKLQKHHQKLLEKCLDTPRFVYMMKMSVPA